MARAVIVARCEVCDIASYYTRLPFLTQGGLLLYTDEVIEERKPVRRWLPNFIKVAFAVALALLFVLVLRSLATLITPPPGPITEPYPDVSTEELCQVEGGRWVTQGGPEVSVRTKPVPLDGRFQAYCQGPLKFERERDAAYQRSQQVSLFVFAIGGALAVISSLLISALKPVLPGLMLGGIVAFFIAGVNIWQLAAGLGRLITIMVIFIAVVGAGLYAFREKT